MRFFKTAGFARFARKEDLSDSMLCEAARCIDGGLYDADLGGGVYKQRLSRSDEGKSGGYRLIVCLKQRERAFFVHGFSKSAKDNITPAELRQLKQMAGRLFSMTDEQLARSKAFSEIAE